MFTDTEVALSMRYNAEMRGMTREVQALIDRKNIELGTALTQVAELQRALALQQAHSAGLRAQLEGMKAAHPQSPMLAETGRHYEDGDPELRLHALHNKAFDAVVAQFKITGDRLRLQAK